MTLLAIALVSLVRHRDGWPPEVAPFGLFAAVGFAVHLPISAYVRMLIPLLPLLVWLIVVGLTARQRTSQR